MRVTRQQQPQAVPGLAAGLFNAHPLARPDPPGMATGGPPTPTNINTGGTHWGCAWQSLRPGGPSHRRWARSHPPGSRKAQLRTPWGDDLRMHAGR